MSWRQGQGQELGPVVFVGHSVNATTGVPAAAREPERFAGDLDEPMESMGPMGPMESLPAPGHCPRLSAPGATAAPIASFAAEVGR
ncbi:hypothetical protein ABZ177_03770 [Streptomyces sp. NPDC006284]|uniref:hypothetical protein n=1 Tax=Streptomyces sp. NPDC006284 TaxID=3156742 RepID=UPI0033B8D1B9